RYVVVDPQFFRPAEVYTLTGNAEKARLRLGWSPRVGFDELVRRMVVADLEQMILGNP
ncbi:MAG: GDP-mannose 4,6-dehydratase, partial [Anaerolineaceae bacterium]|nr:GDP-mannose 4,6-dehydratase [Anaerolineaceae bacterium]